jgi:hypothetical protein
VDPCAADAPRLGGQTASVNPPASLVRGKPGGQVASANTPAVDTGEGIRPIALNPAPSCFDPGALRALALLDVARKAQRKPASVAKEVEKPVTKAGTGRRMEILISSAGVRRVDPATPSSRLNLFK